MEKFKNLEQSLVKYLADWLDSDYVVLEQICIGFSEVVNRAESELHINMAKAAMEVYKEAMTKNEIKC